MRVAIVYPEVLDLARFKEQRKEFPPFGPLYLGAVLEQHGYQVELIKGTPGTRALDLSRFQAVGFSISASATYGLLRDLRFASRYAPGTLIMAGGVHANFFPERTLTDFQAHVVGVGECEQTILDLLEAWPDGDFASVPGVCYRAADGVPRCTSARPLLKNIDVLPMPARHLMPRDDLIMADRLGRTDLSLAHVMFSRGCPFPCTFCASAHTQMQVRSGSSARQELVHLIESYGIEGFAIVDDNFVVNKKKVAEIARSIADLGLRWSALSRVDTVDEDLLRGMRAAGCIEIKFGIESGSEQLLQRMRKNTTQEKIVAAVTAATNVGINVKAFIIHGYPGENLQTTRETISLLDRLGDRISRVSVFRFVPLPGTEAYTRSAELGIRGTDQDPDWDGDWAAYHIHHNERHWWGDVRDFVELNRAHGELTAFVNGRWPERHELVTG